MMWDLHTHHLPPCYVDAIRRSGTRYIDGIPIELCKDVLGWRVEAQLNHQDALGIEKAYIGISSPGVHLTPGDNDAARRLARECNDWTSATIKEHGDRLGMFASLPLPDVEGSVQEARRMSAEKGVNHFVVMTNSHGVYLGDGRLDALWKSLDEMNAVVSIHPTAPCVRQPKAAKIIPSFRAANEEGDNEAHLLSHGNPLLSTCFDPLIEYSFETARAITTMLLTDVFGRFPNIRWIVPHAGGALSSVLDRVLSAAPLLPSSPPSIDVASLKRNMLDACFFDLAGAPFPHQIEGLLVFLGGKEEASTRLVYGSDFREYMALVLSPIPIRTVLSGFGAVNSVDQH